MVGVRGFEPPTPSSRTMCATRLRYTPTLRPIRGQRAGLIGALITRRKRDARCASHLACGKRARRLAPPIDRGLSSRSSGAVEI